MITTSAASLFAYRVDEGLDLVGDVRNNTAGLTSTRRRAPCSELLFPVYLAGGQVGELVQTIVDEALVVAEVEVGLRRRR